VNRCLHQLAPRYLDQVAHRYLDQVAHRYLHQRRAGHECLDGRVLTRGVHGRWRARCSATTRRSPRRWQRPRSNRRGARRGDGNGQGRIGLISRALQQGSSAGPIGRAHQDRAGAWPCREDDHPGESEGLKGKRALVRSGVFQPSDLRVSCEGW